MRQIYAIEIESDEHGTDVLLTVADSKKEALTTLLAANAAIEVTSARVLTACPLDMLGLKEAS